MDDALSHAEMDTLEDFLSGPALEHRSMDLSMLEGFLSAIAIGPHTVMPSDWMPWVWDAKQGTAGPDFANIEQAQRITTLLLRFYNDVIRRFMNDAGAFEPLFWKDAVWGAAEWSEGFLAGTEFCDDEWCDLWGERPDLLEPFLRLGTDEGLATFRDQEDAQMWMEAIQPALLASHAFWLDFRLARPEGLVYDSVIHGEPSGPVRRVEPKVGRNDPCPCGSGRKFKKCCGSGAQSVH